MTTGTLYLDNARFLDHETLQIRRGALRVGQSPDDEVEIVTEIPTGAERLDCAGKLVTHAFAIAHHHIYSALARGMPPPRRVPTTFLEILELVWWNLDKQLDLDMIRASAAVAAVEAARCGVTFLIDHHSSPNAAEGSLHAIAEELDRVGLAHLLCYELSDRDGTERLERGWSETESYLQTRRGLVGLHASFTVTDALLERAVDLARRTSSGIHVHVAEAASDQEHCLEHYQKRVVQRFADAGALQLPATLLAHCLHLDDAERALVGASPSWVVQNTESNDNNAVGRFDGRGFADRVLIGTDGMHSDALQSARAAYLSAQSAGALSPADAYRRLRAVHGYLARNEVPGDGDNNLVVLDYPAPTAVESDNWAAHVFYGLSRAHVVHVIAAGRLIVRDRRLTTVDEAEVLARGVEQSQRLWAKL